ncbi:hypothetical protein [Amycolatopsis sp. WGS_07]|uniref:hypothetical protein n=1 Tax=Amycolatopsis sp. WGS_07 TaxID=3076764 RepID=UPI0038738474
MPGRHRAPTAARRNLQVTREAVTRGMDSVGAVAARALDSLLPRTLGDVATSAVDAGFLPGTVHPETRR